MHAYFHSSEDSKLDDPVGPGFSVEQEETRIVLDVMHTLSTRMNEQQQKKAQRTTQPVAIASLSVAVIFGVAQVIVAVCGF